MFYVNCPGCAELRSVSAVGVALTCSCGASFSVDQDGEIKTAAPAATTKSRRKSAKNEVSPEVKAAEEFRDRIVALNRLCAESREIWEELKEKAKQAKDRYDVCVDELRSAIDAESRPLPLFDETKNEEAQAVPFAGQF